MWKEEIPFRDSLLRDVAFNFCLGCEANSLPLVSKMYLPSKLKMFFIFLVDLTNLGMWW